MRLKKDFYITGGLKTKRHILTKAQCKLYILCEVLHINI